jgi:Suppressor of fused protein (SUFU)
MTSHCELEHYGAAATETAIRFLWLLPITNAEREYTKAFGVEALESKLDEAEIDFANPARPSVV